MAQYLLIEQPENTVGQWHLKLIPSTHGRRPHYWCSNDSVKDLYSLGESLVGRKVYIEGTVFTVTDYGVSCYKN